MGPLAQAATQVSNLWRSWGWGRRLSVALGAGTAILLFAGTAFWVGQEDQVPLLTNLSPEDAAAITEELRTQHVPFELAAGGTAVLVPAPRVHELRIGLAASGLPRGSGVGFEIFEKQSFGMSRFSERLNFLRALQGELQRTVRQLEPVKEARVHIVAPEKRLFRSEEDAPRASVTLHLHRGRRLSEAQTQAVVHLISSAVAGMSPKDVTVVDGAGTILARGGEEEGSMRDALAQQRKIERSLERRLRETLERVVGPGNADVQVSAEINHTRLERTTETYDPDGAVVRSEQVSDEQQTAKAAAPAQGIPGTRSNLPGTGAGKPAGNTGSGRRNETRNYEISKTISREVAPVARLDRLSIAVLVNEVPAEQLAALEGIVKKAAGFDVTRGDQVEIRSMPFASPQPQEEAVLAPWERYVRDFWRPVLGVILVLLVAFVVVRRRRKASGPELISSPITVRELEASLGTQSASPAVTGAQPNALALNLGRPDPARAAAVLKGWMGEQ